MEDVISGYVFGGLFGFLIGVAFSYTVDHFLALKLLCD